MLILSIYIIISSTDISAQDRWKHKRNCIHFSAALSTSFVLQHRSCRWPGKLYASDVTEENLLLVILSFANSFCSPNSFHYVLHIFSLLEARTTLPLLLILSLSFFFFPRVLSHTFLPLCLGTADLALSFFRYFLRGTFDLNSFLLQCPKYLQVSCQDATLSCLPRFFLTSSLSLM